MTACARLPRLTIAMTLLGFARTARAQMRLTPPPYAEYRVDGISGRGTALEAGGGVSLPMGIYVRLGVDGAAGTTWRDGGLRTSGRVDAIARFLLDPFREVPVGLSLGGGLTVPYVQGDKTLRPLVAAVVDIEGRMHGRFTPAVQLGLGGGARLGVVIRTSPPRFR